MSDLSIIALIASLLRRETRQTHKQSTKFKEAATICCTAKKITSPPNEWRNIPFPLYRDNHFLALHSKKFKRISVENLGIFSIHVMDVTWTGPLACLSPLSFKSWLRSDKNWGLIFSFQQFFHSNVWIEEEGFGARPPRHHTPMHHQRTDAMHGLACPSTKTQIWPHLTYRTWNYMILLLDVSGIQMFVIQIPTVNTIKLS